MKIRKTKNGTRFSASDVENNLYDIATGVINRKMDPKNVLASISAYNSIIRLQGLKLRAQLSVGGGTKKSSNFLISESAVK